LRRQFAQAPDGVPHSLEAFGFKAFQFFKIDFTHPDFKQKMKESGCAK
jgi:hypothetical protein